MKNYIPIGLIYLRLLLGFLILSWVIFDWADFSIYCTLFLVIGLLSDVFDGIIARKLNISTVNLRRLDSSIDQIFFSCVVVAIFMHCPAFLKQHWLSFTTLMVFEAATYVISYFKFRKEVATHTIGAKLWTLLLVATLIEINFKCDASFLYGLTIAFGVLTRLEISLILFILKDWTNDVPTFYHAILLRKGKTIKRNKLFNG